MRKPRMNRLPHDSVRGVSAWSHASAERLLQHQERLVEVTCGCSELGDAAGQRPTTHRRRCPAIAEPGFRGAYKCTSDQAARRRRSNTLPQTAGRSSTAPCRMRWLRTRLGADCHRSRALNRRCPQRMQHSGAERERDGRRHERAGNVKPTATNSAPIAAAASCVRAPVAGSVSRARSRRHSPV
jgi:hypothetical protein